MSWVLLEWMFQEIFLGVLGSVVWRGSSSRLLIAVFHNISPKESEIILLIKLSMIIFNITVNLNKTLKLTSVIILGSTSL